MEELIASVAYDARELRNSALELLKQQGIDTNSEHPLAKAFHAMCIAIGDMEEAMYETI